METQQKEDLDLAQRLAQRLALALVYVWAGVVAMYHSTFSYDIDDNRDNPML